VYAVREMTYDRFDQRNRAGHDRLAGKSQRDAKCNNEVQTNRCECLVDTIAMLDGVFDQGANFFGHDGSPFCNCF
jgi:hypothetical protein